VLSIKCSKCGREVEYMGVTIMKQWRGKVCVPCGRVYCSDCIEVGKASPISDWACTGSYYK
jgi:hypothetical protein